MVAHDVEESIYNLVPPPQEVPMKPPMYRSTHTGKITPSEFQFGGRTVRDHATFGRADGSHSEHPALFLKSHAKEPQLPAPAMPTAHASTRLKVKAPTPARDERPVMGLTSNKNFITVNAVKAILMEAKKPAPEPMVYTSKPDFGKVPNYLKRNKDRIAAERSAIEEYLRLRETAGASNAVPMGEGERKQLLRFLKTKWATVNEIYQKLPVATDTEQQKRRKEAIEKELADIEKDVRLLERGDAVMIVNE